MNLLDENIQQHQGNELRLHKVPFRWVIEELAPSGTKDPEIISLLHQRRDTTFFTHDRDFFRRNLSHRSYCLVWLDVFDGQAAEFIRKFLKHPQFNTAAKRMAVVARVHKDGVHYWIGNSPSLHRQSWIAGPI